MYSIFGLNSSLRWIESLNYFIYGSIKIMFLLFIMIFVIGLLRTYIPKEKIKNWISNKKYGVGNIWASLFGAATPFCSCSSIPIFLSFIKAGVPLGIAFSFLITSPLVNEYLVVLMWGFFGWKITLAYVLSGILVGVLSGLILGRMKLEKHLVGDLFNNNQKNEKEIKYNFEKRLNLGLNEAGSIIRKLWFWILLGVGIGAIIHNYIPTEVIQSIVSAGGFWSVPLAVILGVPMYGSCAAILPIAIVLFQKGLPIGTALAFMMAVSALSLPEAVILRRVMNLRLILIFFGIVALAIIFTGFLFNILQIYLV